MTATWTPPITGVPMAQVGPTYDLALGYYDPSTQQVNMVGYVIPKSGHMEESTDTTDAQHLISISSPSSSDRFARFPQVSQGDWTHGERQRVFIDATMYYESDGSVDVSTPGRLTLFPATLRNTYTTNGVSNATPLAADETQWFAGIKTSTSTVGIGHLGAAPVLFNWCNGHELFDLLYTPNGLFALTDEGIWNLFGYPSPSASHFVNETQPTPSLAVKSMAYLGDVLYWIKNNTGGTSVIRGYDFSTGTTTDMLSRMGAAEADFQAICSTASGIFFVTTSQYPVNNFLYSWGGSAPDIPVRIGEVPGRVEYCTEVRGTVYVLVRQHQASFGSNPDWTLYAVVKDNVSLVDDARSNTDPTFTPSCTAVDTFAYSTPTTSDFRPMLWGDGRFLYVAWPGLATRRIDLDVTGLAQMGSNETKGQGSVQARRCITTAFEDLVDLSAWGTTLVVNQYNQASTSGTLTHSFMDFDSPGTVKLFRAVEFQTEQPLVETQAINWNYRLNPFDAYSPMAIQQVGTRAFRALFPVGTKGVEVQLQVQLVAGDSADGAPVVTSMTVVADLGRVIQQTLSCARNQQAHGEVDGVPLTGKELQANILNIRNVGGGRCFVYLPDPTSDSGASMIQAELIDYQRKTPDGMSPGWRAGEDGTLDMESTIMVTLVESWDA